MNDDALDIIHRDEALIAINKPPGLLVHRSAIDKHETRFAMQVLRNQIGQRVWPVHRLDKPTSGVLLFGLNQAVATQLGAQFSNQQTRKTYLAIVRGWPDETGRIDYPLVEQLDKMTDQQAQQNKPAQSAITDWERLATIELPVAVTRYPTSRYALLRITPHTGRKHQIRRHLHHIHHPIIGDTTHGEGRHNRFFRNHYGIHRLLLAAVGLTITHPVSGKPLTLTAPAGESFDQLASEFGWPSTN